MLYVALTRAKTWLGIGLCPVLILANKQLTVSGDVQPAVIGLVDDSDARRISMVRCPECSQHKCATPNVIRNFPRLRWCGNYTEGEKPAWDKQKRVFVYGN